jgi:hypothetical protein
MLGCVCVCVCPNRHMRGAHYVAQTGSKILLLQSPQYWNYRPLTLYLVLASMLFVTVCHYVAQGSLELQSYSLSLPCTGITGLSHHA